MGQLCSSCWFAHENEWDKAHFHSLHDKSFPSTITYPSSVSATFTKISTSSLSEADPILTRITTMDHSIPTLFSVKLKERHQMRTTDLPTGARTLFVLATDVKEKASTSEETSHSSTMDEHPISCELFFRGLNKFVDVDEIGVSWLPCLLDKSKSKEISLSVGTTYQIARIVMQRKLGGFIVGLYSLDGKNVSIVSKHSMDGIHVGWARDILNRTLGRRDIDTTNNDSNSNPPPTEADLAQFLFNYSFVILCECIDIERDASHPMLDYEFDKQLVAFAIQRRDTVCEYAVPVATAKDIAELFGLPWVPQTAVDATSDGIDTLFHKTLQDCGSWSAAHEGYVLTLELSRSPSALASAPNNLSTDVVRPLRIKFKTIGYKIARLVRSYLLGEMAPSTTDLGSQPLLFQSFVTWFLDSTYVTNEKHTLFSVVTDLGWRQLFNEFLTHLGEEKLDVLVRASTAQLMPLTRIMDGTRVHLAPSLLTVIMMCGLPGSGKSTTTRALCSYFAKVGVNVAYIERDVITAEAQTEERNAGRSENRTMRFARRRAQKRIDRSTRASALELLAAAAEMLTDTAVGTATMSPSVLILDACNASEASRAHWRSLLPPFNVKLVTLYLKATPDLAVGRAICREVHPTLSHNPSEVQDAIYKINKIFEPPQSIPGVQDVLELKASSKTNEIVNQVIAFLVPGGGASLMQSSESANRRAPRITESYNSAGYASLFSRFLTTLSLLNRESPICAKPLMCGLGGYDKEWLRLRSLALEALASAMTSPSTNDIKKEGSIEQLPSYCVTAGHTRWLKALIDTHSGSLHHKMAPALSGHCTLAYAPPQTQLGEVEAVSASFSSYLDECGLFEGKGFAAIIDGVVADQQCIALSIRSILNEAAMGQLDTTKDDESAALSSVAATNCLTILSSKSIRHTPLHLTVALRDGTKPFYAAELCETVEQLDNRNVEAMRLRAQKREREVAEDRSSSTEAKSKVVKCRNFIRISFTNPLVVSGGKVYIK